MNGTCVTCAKHDTCFYSSEKILDCTRYEPKPETNYEKLFGTPERATQTLTHVCQFTHGGELCDRCQAYLFDSCDRMLRLGSEQKVYDALLEWLESEVRDD